jgi:hypothetical protein
VVCTPTFHCVDAGISPSYGQIELTVGGPCVSRPLESCCSSAYRTVLDVENGGLPTCEYIVSPDGRSWKRPMPPRTTRLCSPVTSYAMPNRGATTTAGHV